jgi:hypothetical protein
MTNPHINYAPRADATPESERAALVNVYRLALDSAKKRGRLPDKGDPDDGTESKGDSANERIIQ